MKSLVIILISTVVLSACNRESSPDGRSRIRDEKLQLEIDSLKDQNKAILDSISVINKKLQAL
jgi:PBP1b-binding outer membrane lipoprotein LpoB